MTLTAPPETKPQSRRVLLAGALGGLAAWVATAIGRAAPVEAAPGDPIRMGRLNRAGETSTELRAGTAGDVFRVVQNRRGVGLRAEGGGTAINATTTNPSRFGLFAQNTSANIGTGAAIKAVGNNMMTGIEIEHGDGQGLRVTSVSADGECIHAATEGGTAVYATSSVRAIWATSAGVAGQFDGEVAVDGRLDVTQFVGLTATTEPVGISGSAQLFSRTNPAGKTELCVKFGTGAAQVIATQT